jgi:hypothetical protein
MIDSATWCFTPAAGGIPDQNALRRVVLTAIGELITVAALVLLAGCLTCHTEAMGYVWPADAQRHCMVDECC